MARVLRTDGIAADLVSCVAVDDDGTTIREFKHIASTIAPTIGVGVPQADTWNGVPWFSIPNGAAGRLTWTPSNPLWSAATGATEVLLIRYAGKSGTTATLILTGGSSLNRIATISGNDVYSPTGTAVGNITGSPIGVGDKRIVGRTQQNTISLVGYSFQEDGTPDGVPNDLGAPTLTVNDYRTIMGGSDTNFVLGDLFLCAIFNRPLTQGEMNGFAADPFGSLFVSEAVADPVITASVTNVLATSGTLNATTNIPNGTLWGVVTLDPAQPSADQIKAGEDASGLPALRSNSRTLENTSGSMDGVGFEPETTYYVWLVQDSAAGGTSNVAGATFTTTAVPIVADDESLNDAILRATGGPTVNDGLFRWYLAQPGGAGKTTLGDAERAFLETITGLPPSDHSINDLWVAYLVQSGYSPGSLNDMLLRFWREQPTPPVTVRAFDAGWSQGWS